MTSSLSLLAATDFSAPARHALERAAQLAAAHPGAQLTLAHVVSASMLARLRGLMRDEAPAMEARLADETAQALTELAARLGTQYTCPVNTRLAQGSALDVINDLANELQSNLLVMGARGAHFVREFLLGSTIERVLCRTRRPVLAVKHRPQ
ncbi:MAG TPA: universal stress protein, partial [Thiobacillus sp.]|nr:universal stress protein [Thiobacillus sp.]